MNLARSLLKVALFAFLTGNVLAAVSQQEADQLGGDTLTEFGAEKAGNAEGTIPPYTGGLSVDTAPADRKKDSGRYDHTPLIMKKRCSRSMPAT